MAFGLNRIELIGRLGAAVTVNHLASGVLPTPPSRSCAATSAWATCPKQTATTRPAPGRPGAVILRTHNA